MHYDIDAAIFDMDGTLLDTMRYWRYTTLEFLLAHQMPVRNEDLLRMHYTSSRKLLLEIAEREKIEIGTRETVVAELEGYMNRHYLYDCRLKESAVPDFLRRLRDLKLRLCVATGSPREYARNGLSRVGILDFFEFVTDNYERGDGVRTAGYQTYTYSDDFSYYAAGVPSTVNGFLLKDDMSTVFDFYVDVYHSQYDTPDTYNEAVMDFNIKYYGALAICIDTMPALYLDFTAQAERIEASIDEEIMSAAGVDMDAYRAALEALRAAAEENLVEVLRINAA